MASNEQLKEWRALGVKSMTISGTDEIRSVEFFPRSLLDVTEFAAGEGVDPMEAPTDRPPPAGDEDGPPNMPPAMARILSKGSVS